ncbi:hypothetical protein GH5_05589 [Leishmania sp. Ghana 2012 LV757]|uniref:hypothetical protein n=1 Tax=Leishmania sp. Ghana 2012 LV757 TaxID=2803181 RepID=UPI001B7C35AC|nr:hypothetical protein GH5_05589 [Leishmania sp. Ghana 2012 LV757]
MFHPFEYLENFHGLAVSLWMGANPELPFLAAVLYIAFVLYVPSTFMSRRPAYDLRWLSAIWNLILSVFSLCGAYYCIPLMFKSLLVTEFTVRNYTGGGTVTMHGSFYNAVCGLNDSVLYDGPVGAFVCFFILSKIPEMLDTAFLIFQKKPVIFLHWYHHTTVMLYCWHSYVVRISGGFVFASMNYGVHSVMYLYYFICVCGYRKYVRPFAPIITFLQIAQMVVGMFIEVYMLYIIYLTDKHCHLDATNARLGFMMYLSYFVLFSKLFYENYISGRKRRNAEATSVSNDKQKHFSCAENVDATVEAPAPTPATVVAPPLSAKQLPDLRPVKKRH